MSDTGSTQRTRTVGPPRGPLFVYQVLSAQMRVGKPREPYVALELREDAEKGDRLILCERDISHINDSIEVDRAMGRVKTPKPLTFGEILAKVRGAR